MRGAEFSDRLAGFAVDGVATAAPLPVRASGRHPEAQSAAFMLSLSAAFAPGDAALWVTLAPPADPALPGELLRQLRAAGHAVQGFVDRAALLAAWLQGSAPIAVLDLSRHRLSVSVAACEAGDAGLRRNVQLAGGEQSLHDAWLNLAAATLVQQTRFDPLHDLRHESQLREQLPAMAAQALRDGQGQCRIDAGREVHELTLTRDQFAAASAAWLRPLGVALQALSAADEDCVLIVPESLLEIPGLDETLAAARFASLHRCSDGLAACAASLLPPSEGAADGAVPFRSRLPLLAVRAPLDLLQPLVPGGHESGVMATHVVYRGRVLRIPADGLVIGRDPGDAGLRLPEGVAGLSRRHCTLRREGARTQIIDHSGHGSFLDGARVRGRALLAAGGTLRLGDPGVELSLVALDGTS